MNTLDKIKEGVLYDDFYISKLRQDDFYEVLDAIEKVVYIGHGWLRNNLNGYDFNFRLWYNAAGLPELYLILNGKGFNDKMIIYDCSEFISYNYNEDESIPIQNNTIFFFTNILGVLERELRESIKIRREYYEVK